MRKRALSARKVRTSRTIVCEPPVNQVGQPLDYTARQQRRQLAPPNCPAASCHLIRWTSPRGQTSGVGQQRVSPSVMICVNLWLRF